MNKMSHWRTTSMRVIFTALESGRAAGLEGNALEQHVSAAYPFGERAMHPYKIWLHEFAKQVRGSKKPFERRKPKAGPKLLGEWPGEAQGDLFEGDA